MAKFRFAQAFVESALTRRQQDVQHAMDIANKSPATQAMCDAAVNKNRAALAALQQARPGNGRSHHSIFYVDPKDARLQAQETRIKAQDAQLKAQETQLQAQETEIEAMRATIARQEAEIKEMHQMVNGLLGTLDTPVSGHNVPITVGNVIDGPLSGACEYIPAGLGYSIEGSSSRCRGSSRSSDGGSSRPSSSQGSCSSEGSSIDRMSWGSSGGSSDNGFGGKAQPLARPGTLFVRRLSSSTGGGASGASLSPQRSVVGVTGPSPFRALMRASAAPVSSSSDKSATCGKLPTASQPASLAPASSLQQQPPTYDDLMAEMEVTYEALSRRMGSSSSSSSSSGGGSKGSMEEAGVSGPSEAGNGDIRSSSSSSSSSSSRGSVEADQGAKEGAPKSCSGKVVGSFNSSSSSRKGRFTQAARGKQAAAATKPRSAAAKQAAAAPV